MVIWLIWLNLWGGLKLLVIILEDHAAVLAVVRIRCEEGAAVGA